MVVSLTAAGCGGGRLAGGSGGAGGIDVALCNQLSAEYAAALPATLVCTPGALHQCETLVALTAQSDLFFSGCGGEYVNDKTPLDTIMQRYQQACYSGPIPNSPIGSCIPATPHANCVPTGPGASIGTCVPYGADAGAEIVPDGGESCDQLLADYAAAVSAARVCTPGAPYQCQQSVKSSLFPCNGLCPPVERVNWTADVQDRAASWAQQCGPTCFDDVCPWVLAEPAVCVPVDGGTGTCMPQAPDGGAPDAAVSCDQATADYAAAANAAIACTPGAPDQCQVWIGMTPRDQACGICRGHAANDATGVNEATKKWVAACGPVAGCNPLACNSPPAICVAVGSQSPTGGVCLNVLGNLPDAGN
jgi:hypothetical protein